MSFEQRRDIQKENPNIQLEDRVLFTRSNGQRQEATVYAEGADKDGVKMRIVVWREGDEMKKKTVPLSDLALVKKHESAEALRIELGDTVLFTRSSGKRQEARVYAEGQNNDGVNVRVVVWKEGNDDKLKTVPLDDLELIKKHRSEK